MRVASEAEEEAEEEVRAGAATVRAVEEPAVMAEGGQL